jgi:hypothetical protein
MYSLIVPSHFGNIWKIIIVNTLHSVVFVFVKTLRTLVHKIQHRFESEKPQSRPFAKLL